MRYTEHLPNAPEDDRGLPDLSFAFYDRLVIFDNVTKTMTVVVLVSTETDGDLRRHLPTRDSATGRSDRPVGDASTRFGACTISSPAADLDLAYESNFTQQTFEDAVRKCVEYIRAGDIFQVVISQRLKIHVDSDPFDIYRTLRVINPSPFMFFLRTPDVTLVGSSPEIMCRVMQGRVTVRPLAGTRPRGQDRGRGSPFGCRIAGRTPRSAPNT